MLRREWKQYEPLRYLLPTQESGAYWMPRESDRPTQFRKAFAAAAAGGYYPHCLSASGRPPDSGKVALRFPHWRSGYTGRALAARFNGPVDLCYAQGASHRDGRDAAPRFLDGTAVPLCRNPGIGSATPACRDRNGVRIHPLIFSCRQNNARGYKSPKLFLEPNFLASRIFLC